MAISVVIGLIIVVLGILAIGIVCSIIHLYYKKKRVRIVNDGPVWSNARDLAVQSRRQQYPLPTLSGGYVERVIRPIEDMEQIPSVSTPGASSTVSRRLSVPNSATIVRNEFEPTSPPPPPLPPRNTTRSLQRNATQTVSYNRRNIRNDDDDVFQLPPSELTPVLARNSLLRTSRSSHVQLTPAFLDRLGLGVSPFLVGSGSRLDLFPWLQQASNAFGQRHTISGQNLPFKEEDDLPPSYEEAMKAKAAEDPKQTEISVDELESTDL